MKVRSSILLVLGSVLIVSAVAGCSNSGSAVAATSSTASAGDSGAAAGGGAAPVSASCKQLTIAEVQPLVDDKITAVTVTTPQGGGQQCTFKGAAATLSVLVIGGDLAAQTYAVDVASFDPATAVPGVGSKAVRGDEDAAVSSIDGNLYCAIRPADSGDVPGVAALMQAAGDSSNISPAAYQVAAIALGTLCNRIYGSGNTTPDLSGIPKVSAAPTS